MNHTHHPASGESTALSPSRQENPEPSASERMNQAVARIEASRSALIVCLSPEPPTRRSTVPGGVGQGGDGPSFVEALMARIERNGLVQGSWRTARTLARRWWTRQPWHRSVDLVGQTLLHQARPLMRRHPMTTLAVGAAVGAGLVAAISVVRPWVWSQLRGKSSPWGDRMGALVWTQLTSAPVQMALAGALATWLADRGKPNTPNVPPSNGG